MKKTKTDEISSLLKKYNQGVKIDLGCGSYKQKGFIGMDLLLLDGVDIVHDLEIYPWPLPDKCASVLMASHLIEHINPAKQNFLKFMNEAWRILKPGGQFMISLPYAGSPGYWQDPTHVNGCTEATWAYFDPLAGGLYRIYEPAPWKIINCFYQVDGNMEVLLEKRIDDISYHKDKQIKYK